MNWESKCKQCNRDVHCCRFKNNEGFVFVDLKSAEKIGQKTGKKYGSFLDYSPLQAKFVKAMKNEDSHLEGNMRVGLLDENNRILRLKIKENGNCMFLNDVDGRCEIYDIRPNICRIYPLWAMRLINGNLKVIRHDEHPACEIVKMLEEDLGDETDMEEVLSKDKVREIKQIMKNIEKENEFYKKNIVAFVSKNKLV